MPRKVTTTITVNIKEGPELLKEIQEAAKRTEQPVSRYLIECHKYWQLRESKDVESNPGEAREGMEGI